MSGKQSPSPSPSKSPPRRAKSCDVAPQQLTRALDEARLRPPEPLLPGNMLPLNYESRNKLVRSLLIGCADAQRLLRGLFKLHDGLLLNKTWVLLGLKLWVQKKQLSRAQQHQFLISETARLFLFVKGSRAVLREEAPANVLKLLNTSQEKLRVLSLVLTLCGLIVFCFHAHIIT